MPAFRLVASIMLDSARPTALATRVFDFFGVIHCSPGQNSSQNNQTIHTLDLKIQAHNLSKTHARTAKDFLHTA